MLTVAESAEVLGLPPATLRGYLHRRLIPYVKYSRVPGDLAGKGAVRIDMTDLEAFIEARKVPARVNLRVAKYA